MLGLVYQESPSGHLILNKRTKARVLSTQEIETDYPWASSVEAEIFLRGFDAGEQFAVRPADTGQQELAE